MRTFYAFEFCTDEMYTLFVTTNESERDTRLTVEHDCAATDGVGIETYSVGQVEAVSQEAAVTKIQAGDWEYSQKV